MKEIEYGENKMMCQSGTCTKRATFEVLLWGGTNHYCKEHADFFRSDEDFTIKQNDQVNIDVF